MTATLFDWDEAPLPVRRSDPATSRAAARSVDMGARKQEVISAMRLLSRSATAAEIHAVVREDGSLMDIGSTRSRLSQLEAAGLVRKVGVKVVPKPVGSGRQEATWVLT